MVAAAIIDHNKFTTHTAFGQRQMNKKRVQLYSAHPLFRTENQYGSMRVSRCDMLTVCAAHFPCEIFTLRVHNTLSTRHFQKLPANPLLFKCHHRRPSHQLMHEVTAMSMDALHLHARVATCTQHVQNGRQ